MRDGALSGRDGGGGVVRENEDHDLMGIGKRSLLEKGVLVQNGHVLEILDKLKILESPDSPQSVESKENPTIF